MNCFCFQNSQSQFHIEILPFEAQFVRSTQNKSRLLNSQNFDYKAQTQKTLVGKQIKSNSSSSSRKSSESTENDNKSIAEVFSEILPIGELQFDNQQVSGVLLSAKAIAAYSNDKFKIRMVQKSNYESLLLSHKGKNDKWVDPNFTRSNYQIVNDQNIPIIWQSLQSIFQQSGKRMVLVDGKIEAQDIVQSIDLGDCYFLSAVAGLAKQNTRILKLFPTIEINSNGIFMARLLFKGILQEIVVDSFFPINKKTKELFGCRPCKNQSEAYVMILQKCWAKLWQSYQQIDGGYPHEALRALSGGALTKNYYFQNETSSAQKKIEFFNQLSLFDQKKYVMCSGTRKKKTVNVLCEQKQTSIEVQPNHIYSIRQVIADGDEKMVKIYNPWGFNLIAGTSTQISGDFSLKWDDFISSFYYITVCKINDNANYMYTELQNCKSNNFKFIELTITNFSPCYYGMSISEIDRKEKHDSSDCRYICVNFIVLRQYQNHSFQIITLKTNYQYSDHYLELNSLAKGKYLIAIYFTQVEIEESLTFSIYSEGTFAFRERKMDLAFQENFFPQVLLNYNKMNALQKITRYPDPKNKDIWVSFHTMIDDTIFGYYLIHVGVNSQKGLKVNMCRRQFEEVGLDILFPKDTQLIQIKANPGQQAIVAFSAKELQSYMLSDAKYYKDHNRHIHEDLIFRQLLYKL